MKVSNCISLFIKSLIFFTLVVIFWCNIAQAAETENYTYVTAKDVSGSTTQHINVPIEDSRAVLEEYEDMQGYSKKIVIPGLKYTLSKNNSTGKYAVVSDRYVPQGICIAGQYILISAYDYNGVYNSVIYVLNVATNTFITTIILPSKDHCGGVAYDTKNSYIWVCTGSKVSGFSYNLLSEAVTGVTGQSGADTKIHAIDLTSFAKKYTVKTTASYCTYFDGKLWVGQFSENSTSNIYAYTVNLNSGSLTTDYIMEAPQKTQGIAFYKQGTTVYLAVSTSYGRCNDSKIIIYCPSYSSPQTVSGQSYKRILKNDRVGEKTFSPMTQGIAISGNMVYVLLESGATVYQEDNNVLKDPKPFDQYLRYSATTFFGL